MTTTRWRPARRSNRDPYAHHQHVQHKPVQHQHVQHKLPADAPPDLDAEDSMAKALLGHVGAGNDLRLMAEVRGLRARVAQLERELELARATSDAFAASMSVEDDLRTLTLEGSEPALT